MQSREFNTKLKTLLNTKKPKVMNIKTKSNEQALHILKVEAAKISPNKVNADVKEYISKEISNMAENHLDCWKDRYANYGGNKRKMEDDLYINHDPSLEIERVTEDLKRELNDKEYNYVIAQFNKEVIRQWKSGR